MLSELKELLELFDWGAFSLGFASAAALLWSWCQVVDGARRRAVIARSQQETAENVSDWGCL